MRTVEPPSRPRLAGLGAAIGVAILLGWSLAAAQDRRESEAALTAVRKEIKQLQDRITRETARRDEGSRALREAEVEVAAATRKLAAVRGDVQRQQTAHHDLAQESDRANRRLAAEQTALARQVRAS